ncbi:MAG TPA: DUF1937 family protein [Acidimicrobiales bacterium]|nr:DUF1937 family protein [Acidimicrobiales bacterium]
MAVYLAGPMRGYVNFNFPAFDEAAAYLRELGIEVISPAEHDREQGFDETQNSLEGFDLKAALLWDLEQIAEASAVVVLPGWESSQGVDLELHFAQVVDVPVLFYHPEVPGFRLRDEPYEVFV